MAEWHGGSPKMVRFESFAQAQAERDHYKADLEALRGGVERLRVDLREMASERAGDEVGGMIAHGEALGYFAAATRLSALLPSSSSTPANRSTKPNPSLDPAGEEGTGG